MVKALKCSLCQKPERRQSLSGTDEHFVALQSSYPLAGCSSAEPASVSLDGRKIKGQPGQGKAMRRARANDALTLPASWGLIPGWTEEPCSDVIGKTQSNEKKKH